MGVRFEDLIAPRPVADFLRDHFGQRPLHLSSDPARRGLLDWDAFNDLLAIRSHWEPANIALIMNSQPVQTEFYMDRVEGEGGARMLADPAKIDLFLSMGASLVANAVDRISPSIKAVTAALGDLFSARAGANVYCSFDRVQAFASHCDVHEVFVVQCEGEKVWNIYRNRAASPIASPSGPDAQALIDRAKGDVAMQVTMKPGDMLYLPRGVYHDALATAGASLHVTFAVLPLAARGIFPLLEQIALEDEAFRAYLPDPRADGGARLDAELAALADRVAAIIRSKRFADRVADRQRSLVEPEHRIGLPQRRALNFYARGDRPAQISVDADGATLISAQTRLPLGRAAPAAEWLLARPAFSAEELSARFPQVPPEALAALIDGLTKAGVIFAYRPQI